MNIKKIIRKTNLEIDEMCFVIQQYIKERKGVDVKIEPKLTAILKVFGKEFSTPHPAAHHELDLMHEAYNISCAYFFKEGY